jgi:hypothetical protein
MSFPPFRRPAKRLLQRSSSSREPGVPFRCLALETWASRVSPAVQSSRATSQLSSRRQFLALFAFFVLFAALASAQTPQPPATVLLIRHAEKLTDGRIDLAPAGFARAKDLPQLFLPEKNVSNAGTPPKFPRPDALFATHQSKHSNRPFETLEPLSQALNLPINTDFEDDDYAGLAKLLLSGKYAGKVVLVAWHHGKLPQLAAALGIDPQPAPWPATQFDRVWRIDWHSNGNQSKPTLTDLPQQLMPGDSK